MTVDCQKTNTREGKATEDRHRGAQGLNRKKNPTTRGDQKQ